MNRDLPQTDEEIALPVIRQLTQPTVADQVFDQLRQRILSLELPPQTRMSEAEVSRKMGVSRQPVREAFKRLAKLGFLHIRPQSGTTVSLISEEAVLRARFIRTALEAKTCRTACGALSAEGLTVLSDLIEQQKAAVAVNDRDRFHALDDQFHQQICVQAGVGYVWDLIQESKAHLDRIRMLSLSVSSQHLALNEHVEMLNAIRANDPDAAEDALDRHLGRIQNVIRAIKAENHDWFREGMG
ncbi:transcriptional regulator, GntR family [Jannaschia faecimaris]|uniref:Transcriptional regulator, GntR family n=1 Tax=Jannaschia faecimaris TaxID=1244108 RepID=A0A1H3SSN7_9RHOB|nr:GntR family transcriptional regulator [Jannaschia faecimaris]SDZ40688.1 transcriptional regulator, GntR family [Jannaschia faecimaris]